MELKLDYSNDRYIAMNMEEVFKDKKISYSYFGGLFIIKGKIEIIEITKNDLVVNINDKKVYITKKNLEDFTIMNK